MPFCSLALVVSLKCVVSADLWPWLPIAIRSASALFLSSPAMAAAYGVVSAILSVAFRDADYLLIALVGLAGAIVLSGGHYLRVIRNDHLYGADPIPHSPIYGDPKRQGPIPQRPGLLGPDSNSFDCWARTRSCSRCPWRPTARPPGDRGSMCGRFRSPLCP